MWACVKPLTLPAKESSVATRLDGYHPEAPAVSLSTFIDGDARFSVFVHDNVCRKVSSVSPKTYLVATRLEGYHPEATAVSLDSFIDGDSRSQIR